MFILHGQYQSLLMTWWRKESGHRGPCVDKNITDYFGFSTGGWTICEQPSHDNYALIHVTITLFSNKCAPSYACCPFVINAACSRVIRWCQEYCDISNLHGNLIAHYTNAYECLDAADCFCGNISNWCEILLALNTSALIPSAIRWILENVLFAL